MVDVPEEHVAPETLMAHEQARARARVGIGIGHAAARWCARWR
jgi:hypothetical protein